MFTFNKISFKRAISFYLAVFLFIFSSSFLFYLLPAYAVVDTYTVTGGDVAALPDVGATPVALNTIVITEDGAADDFLADPETLRISIPAVNFDPVSFDASVTSLTVGGTCGYTGHDPIAYGGGNNFVDIPLTGGTSCGAGETITIDGLAVETFYSQTASGSFSLITIDNTTTSGGFGVVTSSTTPDEITPDVVNMSLVLDDPVVGAVQDTTLSISSTPFALDDDDTIVINVPSRIDISGVDPAVTGTFENGGEITCAAALQVLTCTVITGPTNSSIGTIIMTGITASDAGTDNGSGEIRNEGVAGDLVAEDTTLVVDNSLVFDANGSVTLADPTVGATQNTTLTLTLPVNLEDADTIEMTMPDYLDVSSTAFVSTTFAGTGFTGCSAAGQLVTCTVDTDLTSGTGNIVMSGMDPIYAENDAIVNDLEVTDVSLGNSIASDYTVSITDTVPDDLTSTSISLVSDEVDVQGPVTIGFTTANALPDDGSITVTFPAGFDVSLAASVSSLTNIDGTFTVGVAGQNVTLTRNGDGAAVPASTAVSLNIHSAINPAAAGATGDFTIQTNSSLGLLDEDDAVAGATIVAAPTVTEEETPASGGGGGGSCIVLGTCSGGLPTSTPTTDPTTDPTTSPGNEAMHTFTDVPSAWADWLNEALAYLQENGIILGQNNDGKTSDVEKIINRAEFAAILSRALNLTSTETDCFPDLKGDWFDEHACATKDAGMINGQGDTGFFDGSGVVNNAELYQIFYNIMGWEDEAECTLPDNGMFTQDLLNAPGEWYYQPICKAYEHELLPPDMTSIDAPDEITRGQSFYGLYKVLMMQ